MSERSTSVSDRCTNCGSEDYTAVTHGRFMSHCRGCGHFFNEIEDYRTEGEEVCPETAGGSGQ